MALNSMRAQLGRRGTQSVGGLLGVPALNPSAATGAVADPNPEAGHHRDRLGQFGLELLSSAHRSNTTPPPQSGQQSGNGASSSRSTRPGTAR